MMNNIAMDISLEYFDWLVELIQGCEHVKLLRHMHETTYIWRIPNDENRADDGEALRSRFLYETNYTDYDLPEKGCSVLEMLVALASRINDILIDIEGDDDTPRWFWMLIENLDLVKFDDISLDEDGNFDEIDIRLCNFMERTYTRNGYGGLFPLNKSKENQRNIEIWYQMSAYLEENYPIHEEY